MMEHIRKLYLETNFSWPKVIIYAIICGIVTGLIMMCPPLDNTSIHQIGVTFEAWIFLGLPICSNAKKPLESALKLFVFFLISQPLVYLTMWPVYQHFPWEFYKYWLAWTFACLPMGFLAYYIKKDNVLGTIVVLLACLAEVICGSLYMTDLVMNFPKYLLAVLFCFAQVPLYVLVFLNGKAKRITVSVISVIVAVGLSLFTVLSGPNSSTGFFYEDAGNCEVSIANTDIAEVVQAEDDMITIRAVWYGYTVLAVTDANGKTKEYPVTVNTNGDIDVAGITDDATE